MSKRVANAKSDKYHGNILRRGKVEITKVGSIAEAAVTLIRFMRTCRRRYRLMWARGFAPALTSLP